MLTLVPTELHRYSIIDMVGGVAAATKSRDSQPALPLPGVGDAVPIRSARAAMIIALRALGMRLGSTIGVPLYCCPVIFKAIKEAGCRIRFLDIDPRTYCLSIEDLNRKSRGCDAVLVVHMFGNVCDVRKVIDVMGNKPVIEDCAQSLGSELDGRASGSFGDISIFSFRSGKYLSVGEGGAIYSKDPNHLAKISALASALPAPTFAEELKHIVNTYIRSKLRGRPLWGLLGSRIWQIYNKRVDFIDKSPIMLAQIFCSDLSTARKRLRQLHSMISSQRANAVHYMNNLKLDPQMLCFEPPPAFYNRYLFPITFQTSGQRDSIAEYLRRNRVDVSTPYQDVIDGASEYYAYEHDCPVAESMLKRTLIIPSHYKIKRPDVERISRCLNKAWIREKTSTVL